MTGYTYSSYVQAVVTQIPTVVTDPNFVTMLPNSIDYAELTCYRDLDFLALKSSFSLGTPVAGTTRTTIATSRAMIVETLSYAVGTNIYPITPASLDFIQACFPDQSSAGRGTPKYFAMVGDLTSVSSGIAVQIAPPSDGSYSVSAYGTQRPTALSGANTATWLTNNVPDLFWAAAMIYWSGYMKNFGSMADDPKMAVSWEGEYQRLLKGAGVEEARRKFESTGWAAQAPTPLAQPRT